MKKNYVPSRKRSRKESTPVALTVADEAELKIAVEERGKNLEKTVKALLPTADACARAQICKALELLSEGTHWLDMKERSGISMAQVSAYRRHFPAFQQLWYAAIDSGADYRKALRERAAHVRAVEGVEKPIFQQGAQVGVVREFDNRLLEFLLKADDPKKYRDNSAVQVNQNNVGVVVEWDFSPDPPKAAKTIEIRENAPPTAKHSENPNEINKHE